MRDYCTRQEIAYLIGEHRMDSWRTIQTEIDRLNLHARADRQIVYYLRKNKVQGAFDIQVSYAHLTNAQRQYLVYRANRDNRQGMPA